MNEVIVSTVGEWTIIFKDRIYAAIKPSKDWKVYDPSNSHQDTFLIKDRMGYEEKLYFLRGNLCEIVKDLCRQAIQVIISEHLIADENQQTRKSESTP